MTWPPVSSEDSRELREMEQERERTQDVARQAVEAVSVLHDRSCSDGWLGEDEHGRPVPCPRCRPGIEERLARSQGRPVTGSGDGL